MSAYKVTVYGEPYRVNVAAVPLTFASDVSITLTCGSDEARRHVQAIANVAGLLAKRDEESVTVRGPEATLLTLGLVCPTDVAAAIYANLSHLRDQRAAEAALSSALPVVAELVAEVVARRAAEKTAENMRESVAQQVNDGVMLKLARLLNDAPPVQRVEVVAMPARQTTTEVRHDESGRITKTKQTEQDAGR